MVQQYVIQPNNKGDRERLKRLLCDYIDKWSMSVPGLIEIKKLVRPRTTKQNATFWWAMGKIREQTGNDVNDLRDLFCGEFYGWVTIDVLGQKKRKPYRTTAHDHEGHHDLPSTEEFMQLWDFMQALSATMGIEVPDPDPNFRRDMQDQIEKERENDKQKRVRESGGGDGDDTVRQRQADAVTP